MNTLNLLIFYFINGGAGHYHVLDTVLLFVTSYLTYGVSSIVALFVMVWVPFRNKTIRGRLLKLKQAAEFVVGVSATWCTVEIVKVIVAAPRPFVSLPHITALSPYEGGYSFPSGHAAMTVAIATLVYFNHKRLGVLLYGFALVVVISRVYIGVHYPIDVAVGGLLGFVIPAILHMVLNLKTNKSTA